MIVGFTGTRCGMSGSQEHQLQQVLELLESSESRGRRHEFHHGLAAGADTEAARVADARGWVVIGHPPAGNPLARNRKIISLVSILVAAPLGDREVLRSGTWATVRYARAAGKPIIFLSRGTP